MKTVMIQLAAVAVLSAVHATASAQGLVEREATGEVASGNAADGARERALDLAFANAVRAQVSEELPPGEVRRLSKAITDKVIRRARLYVKSFRVLGSEDVEGRLIVRIAASLDRDALRAALAELGGGVGKAAPPRTTSSSGRPSIAVILHAEQPSAGGTAIDTTFGTKGSDSGASSKVLITQLGAMGFDIASVAGLDIPTSVGSQGELPMSDAAALALARQVGAGGALVVGLVTDAASPIRATRKQGAVSRASLRALDVQSGKVLVSTRVDAAGYGDDRGQAQYAAARDAGTRAANRAAQAMAAHWPVDLPASIDRGTLLVVRGATQWATIEAISNGARTVTRASGVTLRWFRNGEVAMVIDTKMSAADVASRVGGIALPLGSVSARLRGQRVEVEVDGDRRGSD